MTHHGFYRIVNIRSERLSFRALLVGLLGVGMTLPFYGSEAFGLHAIGQEALPQQSAALMSLLAATRGEPQLTMFFAGLLLLGVSAIIPTLRLASRLANPNLAKSKPLRSCRRV